MTKDKRLGNGTERRNSLGITALVRIHPLRENLSKRNLRPGFKSSRRYSTRLMLSICPRDDLPKTPQQRQVLSCYNKLLGKDARPRGELRLNVADLWLKEYGPNCRGCVDAVSALTTQLLDQGFLRCHPPYKDNINDHPH